MALHYSESGEHHSGPPLVLLHGFCETNKIWSRFRQSLGKDMRVLCPDLPGFGKSALPEGELSLERVAGELYSWLKDLDIESCILCGHSLGGYVCLSFVEEYPQMTEGICLFNSTTYGDTEEKKRTRNNVTAFVEKHGVDKFISSSLPLLFSPQNRERLQPEINELISIARTTSKESLTKYTRAMQQRPDRLHVLKNIEKPVLYIAGNEDTAVPVQDIQNQVQSLKNAELCLLRNCGHMGMYEKPEESEEALKNFASSVSDQKKSS